MNLSQRNCKNSFICVNYNHTSIKIAQSINYICTGFKMKRVALILLISIYAFSCFGIGIRQFYCCGKLKSTSISFGHLAREKCGNGDEKSGCCQTKFQSLKIKDSHIAAGATHCPGKYFSETIFFGNSFQGTPADHQQIAVNNPGHAPPSGHGNPLYILFSNYRI